MQAEMKKEMEQIFASTEKGDIHIVVRGDKRVEKIVVDGVEDKRLKDLINETMKAVDKKVEKQMRGRLGDLGLPGF